MRQASLSLVSAVGLVIACGGSAAIPGDPAGPDASTPDSSVADSSSRGDSAPGCPSGAVCGTNPGAPCLSGTVSCVGGKSQCVDGAPAQDGTSCMTGLCTRGACLPPSSVSGTIDLSSVPMTAGRMCAEAPSYSVVGLVSDTVTLPAAPNTGCLAQGDEVLLINLQGAPMATANVGNWELLTVKSASGTTVTFTAPKTKSYGAALNSDAGIGTGATDQKVALVRVAQFGALSVAANAKLTTAPWDGLKGGVLAMRAAQVKLDGAISATALGYRGGRWSVDGPSCTNSVATDPGESIDGLGTPGANANVGGAGGLSAGSSSFGANTPMQSGASHATVGQPGKNGGNRTIGPPGIVYGANDASLLTLGSGDGGNVTCTGNGGGPALASGRDQLAGGIVLLLADTLDVSMTGSVTSSAAPSGRDVSAAGGYVFLKGTTLNLGAGQVTAVGGTAKGGSPPTSGLTVKAGDGYVVVQAKTVTGTTTPTAKQL